MQLFRKLNRRIPANAEIIAVFNFTVFLIHSWSIRSFLFRLPSMLFYFGIMDIIAVLFYMMAFALLESTLVTAVLVLISILLPGNWFKTNFLYQGFLAVLIAAIASVLLQDYLTNTFPPTEVLLVGSALSILLWILLSIILHFFAGLQGVLRSFVEKFSIFSYIYVPLGLIGILVVLIRNLA